MRRFLWTGIAATVAWAAPASAEAAKPTDDAPVTRILAIGTVRQGANPADVQKILPSEIRETLKLYLAGRIDQWFSLADEKGVVFLLNVTDPAEAHAMLEALPLGQAHLMQFELKRLTPLQPAKRLLP